MAQDARRFVYSSDSSMPYFVYKTEGSVYNSGYIMEGFKKIRHNLQFVPLIVGVWSVSSDFSNAHDIASGRAGQDNKGFQAWADGTYIYFHGTVLDSTATTFYYRIYAYAPPDYTGELTPITDDSTFHFDTDYNYLKIAYEGKVVPGNQRVIAINHNLGYLPIYKVWRTVEFEFWDSSSSKLYLKGLRQVESRVDKTSQYPLQNVSNSNTLTITWNDYQPTGNDYAYYQIYSNEA